MLGKITPKRKNDPWGDDHPEKLNQNSPKTIGFTDQMKGLLSPDKALGQIFGENKSSYPRKPQERQEKLPKQNETLLFSFTHQKEERKVLEQSEVILNQLKEQITLLEKSEKGLSKEISKIKVEQMPARTGIYYIRFLEWMITVVRQLRMKVEDGRAWLSTFNQKKKKRVGYWKMYKKHGTTFGLSHERTLATQTG